MLWLQPIEWVSTKEISTTKENHSSHSDILDPAILRPGRLDKHIYVGLPNAQERFDIIKTITKVKNNWSSLETKVKGYFRTVLDPRWPPMSVFKP